MTPKSVVRQMGVSAQGVYTHENGTPSGASPSLAPSVSRTVSTSTPCVGDDLRPFGIHLDLRDDHAVSDIEPIQHLLEEGVKSAGRVEVRGIAWKAERAHLGDPFKSAELAPNSGHLLEPESPELFVETVE